MSRLAWLSTIGTDPLVAAQAYGAHGFRVIPVHHPIQSEEGVRCSCLKPDCRSIGKHPVHAQWPERATTCAETIAELWRSRPLLNIGLVMGGEARLVALDIDGEKGRATLAALESEHGPLPETLTSRSGRIDGGEHRIFRCPDALDLGAIKNRSSGLGPGLDVRGEGSQIVACPSLHASGNRYAWANDLPPAELPVWLYELMTAERTPPNSPTTAASPEAIPLAERICRASAYLAKIDPAVAGNNGHRQAWLAAVKIVRGFDLPPDVALDLLMREYNPRCQPPWSQEELRHKVDDAHVKADAPAGFLLNEARASAKAEDSEQKAGATERRSLANALIELALGSADLFHSPDRKAFACLQVPGHRETWALESKYFEQWLSDELYTRAGKVAGSQATLEAIKVLSAKALRRGPEIPVHVRIGEGNGAIYLDLANDAWEAVEITPHGWRVVADPLVRFRRSGGMRPLPRPVGGGSLDELRRFLNFAGETDVRLAFAWLVAALRPSGPYPVAIMQGEHGSAKSTTARVLRGLVDPNGAPLRSKTRDERDLMIAANNAWVIALDNLSGISRDLSDSLCRLSTGGGFGIRANYTDADEVLFNVMRPIILTGIDTLATREDFANRSIVLNLPAIPEGKRRDEETFWRDFDEARPRILGGLLDVVAGAMGRVQKVDSRGLPRMADFGRWIIAAEPALGWPDGAFMAAYRTSLDRAAALALEDDPVAMFIVQLMAKRSYWEGTATDLLGLIRSTGSDRLPKASNALGNRLRRVAPMLRGEGIVVEMGREGHEHRRMIRVKKLEAGAVCTVREHDQPAAEASL